MKKDKDRTIRA